MHEPVRRRIWLALVLALVGLAFVVEVWRGISLDGLGVAAALSAAVAYAVYVLMAERAVGRARPRLADLLRLSLRRPLLGRSSSPSGASRRSRLDDDVSLLGHLSEFSLPVWSLMLFVVVVGTMVTFLLVTAALRHISATGSGSSRCSSRSSASVVAFLWLGQSFGATQLVGGSVVLAGILLAQTAR